MKDTPTPGLIARIRDYGHTQTRLGESSEVVCLALELASRYERLHARTEWLLQKIENTFEIEKAAAYADGRG